MPTLRLYKKEKLRSRTSLRLLFGSRGGESRPVAAAPDGSALAFPWRALWRINPDRQYSGATAQFAIIVPKKRLRHAVDRVTMRRRMREAYRLNRHLLPPGTDRLDIVFVYVAPCLTSYRQACASLTRIMSRVAPTLPPPQEAPTQP